MLTLLLIVVLSIAVGFGGVVLFHRHKAPSDPRNLITRLKLEPFTGFGTPDSYSVAGRVSHDGGRLSSLNAEFDRMNLATKLRRNLRRFLLTEMEGVLLEVTVAGSRRETTSGPNGYFNVKFQESPRLNAGVTTYSVRLHEKEKGFEAVKSVGQITIPPEQTSLAVLSDIDDTIVESHIKSKFRMLLHTALTNVSDLHPTPGFSAMLTAIAVGKAGMEANPVYYVSGSPMNLHDKLNAFLRANRFPTGPIFLTAMRLGRDSEFFKQRLFKTDRIRKLFLRFPRYRFILIGDNTQADSEIYQQIALEFPGRVALTMIYERVPRLVSGKILPLGQYRIASAWDGGLLLYRKSFISKAGLQGIVTDMIVADALPESFNVDRKLKQLSRRAREVERRFPVFRGKG